MSRYFLSFFYFGREAEEFLGVDEALPLHTLLDVLYKHSLEWPDLRIWHVNFSICTSLIFFL
jgi:hypothetical protein